MDQLPRHRLDPLTTMRFFAAALVFFSHFAKDVLVHIHAPQPIQELFQHGREAVTFFFLLSGFVLAYSYCDCSCRNGMRVALRDFWWGRFARIYPSYLLALALPFPRKLVGAFWGTIPVSQLYDLPWVLLLVQAWIPSKADAWNPPAWSLSVEAFFYALFPIGAVLLQRVRTRTVFLLTLIALSVTTYLQSSIAPSNPNLAAFFPLFHLPVFCLGMVIGREFLAGHSRFKKPLFPFLIASVGIGSELMFSSNVPRMIWSSSVLVLLYALLILSAAQLSGVFRRVLSFKPLVLLGDASYVFYILHMPLTVALQRLFTFVTQIPPPSSLTYVLLLFAINIGVSVILHIWFEVPVRKRLMSMREV